MRFPREVIDALDRFVASSDAFETRSDVVRTIVTSWLRSNQILPQAAAESGNGR